MCVCVCVGGGGGGEEEEGLLVFLEEFASRLHCIVTSHDVPIAEHTNILHQYRQTYIMLARTIMRNIHTSGHIPAHTYILTHKHIY